MVYLSQKVDENMIFTDYRKVLVLIFLEIRNIVFSWAKKLIERLYLLKRSCFELFFDRKYGLFYSQKVDGKMSFTWSFWAFYDIQGPGKRGFSRCVNSC